MELPEVAGPLACSLADLERRARLHLRDEQSKPSPDNALIATLCDTVRCVREYVSSTQRRIGQIEDAVDVKLASAVAHLLEHFDTGEAFDYAAALTLIHTSGLADWARENAVLLPLRRDGVPQHERFTVKF
jgi:hypothetical protein